MRPTAWIALSALLFFVVGGFTTAQDDETHPGQATIDRARKDAEAVLAQVAAGGSKDGRLDPYNTSIKELKISLEGCEEVKGLVSLPDVIRRDRKSALMFVFTGGVFSSSLEDTKRELKEIAAVSSMRDPVICCSLMYTKEVKEGKNTYRIEQLLEDEDLYKALRWLLDKVISDWPVDKERVFLANSWGGASDANAWLEHEWSESPEKFPFRARFLSGDAGFQFDREMPPIPAICITSKRQASMGKGYGDDYSVKSYANHMRRAGIPCQYHEVEEKFFSDHPHWLQVIRDGINSIGGPGMLTDPTEKIISTEADKISFAGSRDQFVLEIQKLCKGEAWGAAVERMNEILADKEIKSKFKRELKKFEKELQKYVRTELDRLDASIMISVNAEMKPSTLHRRRMTAMVEAFKDESWVKNKPYAEHLELLNTYPPAKREAERLKKFKEATALESTPGKWEEAQKLLSALAKDENADGGSMWAKAAKYRLSWWHELDEDEEESDGDEFE